MMVEFKKIYENKLSYNEDFKKWYLELIESRVSRSLDNPEIVKSKKDILEALDKFENIPEPNTFNAFYGDFRTSAIIDLLVQRDILFIADNEINEENVKKVQDIYLYYRAIENNLDKLVQKFEGSDFYGDKVVNLVRCYLKVIIKNSCIDDIFVVNEFHVDKGSVKLWMNIIDGLVDFMHGNSEKYLREILPLTNFYMEKM